MDKKPITIKIAFHSNQLSMRGTEVALYDYAHYNEKILGNESIIIVKDSSVFPHSDEKAIKKFEDRFPVFFYGGEKYNGSSHTQTHLQNLENILEKENVDFLYCSKSGRNDGLVSKKIPTGIHAVFQENQPHGDKYAFISDWMGKKFNQSAVPYMVDLPEHNENFRNELGIPTDAIVYGRYGGKSTFDISFARNSVLNVANQNKNIYFLFMNTHKFGDLDNIIYLDGSSDLNVKVKFINTCNAMLHARVRGESFGLAIAEFSMKNKQIITYGEHTEDMAHLDMLKDNCLRYHNQQELENILLTYDGSPSENSYINYTPEKIMKRFEEVFLR